MSSGQLWSVNTLGGYMYSDNLSNKLRMAMQPASRMRDFCDGKSAVGLHKGQTFNWDIYSDISDDGTVGSSHLSETATVPTDKYTVSQGSLTIGEWARKVPYTGVLDSLSQHSVEEVIRKVLKNHAVKSLDVAAFNQFKLTKLRVAVSTATTVVSSDLSTSGSTSVTNNVALGIDHVRGIITIMMERNIPTFGSGDYYCIAWPSTYDTVRDNLEAINQYTETGLSTIMNGEVGRYSGCRFIQQTNCAKGTGSTANAAWSNSKSDWALFFGEDTVTEGIAILPEIRADRPTDMGRSKEMGWYALGGFGLTHTAATDSRIVMWDSAG